MDWLLPDWSVPTHIQAATTFRTGGVSRGPFRSWNLAAHVGDDPEAVEHNRSLLLRRLKLPSRPVWLNQTHGSRIVEILPDSKQAGHGADSAPDADASFTSLPETVCVVLTADCLPILLTDGYIIAAVHGGWRGLLNGILDNTLTIPPWQRTPIAWLGPAIGQQAFEVGKEVKEAFIAVDSSFATAFVPMKGKYRADLYGIARVILSQYGVSAIHGGNFCTYCDADRFFSYRRDGICGRMATLIWRSA